MTGLETAAPAATPAPPTPEETTAAVPPAMDVTSTEQPTEGAAVETQEVEQEPNLEETPETSGDFAKYKPLFKDHPELRNIIGREQAYSSLGQFSEVREIVQRIPTVADAEQLVEDSENRREMGRSFREDLPTFVESLKTADPIAFQRFTSDFPNILAETDPQAYEAQSRIYSTNTLNFLARAANQSGDKELLAAVQIIAQSTGLRLGESAAPRQDNSEAARLRKQLQERDEAEHQALFNNFWTQTDSKVADHDTALVEAAMKKAFPQATEDQMYRMVREGFDALQAYIGKQPQTVARLNELRARAEKSAKTGRLGYAEQREIYDYLTGKTKLAVPHATKPVIDAWSKMILKSNQDSIQKKTALAAKTSREVGTGPGATTSAAAPTSAGQGKLHAKDIFAKLADGTYVPPAQRR